MCNEEIKVLHNSFILIFFNDYAQSYLEKEIWVDRCIDSDCLGCVYQVVPYQGHVWKMLICSLGFLSVKIRASWLLHVKIPLRR